MNTRQMNFKSQLKESQATVDRLVEERDHNEQQVRTLKNTVSTLNTKLTDLRNSYDQLNIDYQDQCRVIEIFKEESLCYVALRERILLLEQQLREAYSDIGNMRQQQESEKYNVSSLHSELALETSLVLSGVSKRKVRKYARLNKIITRKSKQLQRIKRVHKNVVDATKEKIYLLQQIDELESNLLRLNTENEKAHLQLQQLSAVSSELLELGQETRKLVEGICSTDLKDDDEELIDKETRPTVAPSITPISPIAAFDNNSICVPITPAACIKRKTIVYSDRLGIGLASELGNCLKQQVTNMCYPGASLQKIIT